MIRSTSGLLSLLFHYAGISIRFPQGENLAHTSVDPEEVQSHFGHVNFLIKADFFSHFTYINTCKRPSKGIFL